jgi:hypothetical protein
VALLSIGLVSDAGRRHSWLVLIKGAGIRSLLLAIEQLEGSHAVAAVKAALPEHVRAQIEPRVLASGQYPVEVSAALQVAVRDVLGGGSWELSHRLGVDASLIDFRGIYRIFLRAIDRDSLWDRIERAFGQYNSQGVMRWIERTKTGARGIAEGVSGFNEGLWASTAGRMQGFMHLSGAKTAIVRAVDPTPESCRFEARWEADLEANRSCR